MMETESIINGLLYSMLIMNVFELTDHLKWFRGALVTRIWLLYYTVHIIYMIWAMSYGSSTFYSKISKSLLVGTIIGYKTSSEREIEDLTYTPMTESKPF